MRVLVVFANPRGTSALRLGEEDRVIQECIGRSKHRDQIRLTIKHAASVDDVRRALLDDEYDMVHFSGHGTGKGLAFEDRNGGMYVPPRTALADLLRDFAPPLQCALLNACYSTSQGEFTSVGVPFTIAMEGAISDDAAVIFTGGLYDSIGAGKDIEFSFRQGIHALRLAGHPDSTAPKLIRQGEVLQPPADTPASKGMEPKRGAGMDQPILLGIALDVSGSMETSINNRVGRQQTRLDSFREALDRGIQQSKQLLETLPSDHPPVRIFAYAFGLRTGDVCDLFSLIKAADAIITSEEVERLKQQYADDVRRRYSGYGGLGDLARSYGFGSLVTSAERVARANAEEEVRSRILAEIQRRLSSRLDRIGETTLELEELAELWQGSTSTFTDAEGLIYGNTPMCRALREAKTRFTREKRKPDHERLLPTFLLVSDGEPTDGAPEEIAAEIRDLGVQIICCYITSDDVTQPRLLHGCPAPTWPSGARRMFDMASPIEEDSPFAAYLLREGWTIEPGARSFIQANHSETLQQLIGFAFSPLETGRVLLPKGV